MPFRQGYGGVYDEATLARLQDIFEYVWLVLADLGEPKISREKLAGMIIGCHEKGMTAEGIKEYLTVDLTAKPLVPARNREGIAPIGEESS